MDATATAIHTKYFHDRMNDRGPWREINATARELPDLRFAVKINGSMHAYRIEHPEGTQGYSFCLSETLTDDPYGRDINDPVEISHIFSTLTWRDSLASVEAEYGRHTGRCGQCGRQLSDEDRPQGVGSRCRRFYGCPWTA